MDAVSTGARPRRRWRPLVLALILMISLCGMSLLARTTRAALRAWWAPWSDVGAGSGFICSSGTELEFPRSGSGLYLLKGDGPGGGVAGFTNTWRDCVVEASVRPRGRVWLAGHLRGGMTTDGKRIETGFDHLDVELPRDRWTTIRLRSFEGVWEISIEGARWQEIAPTEPPSARDGGFGFGIDPGAECEIRDLRVKVLSGD